MGFAESKSGQLIIRGHRKAADKGLQLVILLYGIARANKTTTVIIFAALAFLCGLLVLNLDKFMAFLKKLTLASP